MSLVINANRFESCIFVVSFSNPMTKTNSYIDEHLSRFTEELMSLLRIPSVSADPAYTASVLACANEVAAHLKKLAWTL